MNKTSIKKSSLYQMVKRVYYRLLTPKQIASRIFYVRFGKHINWKHPRDINEKINWLKFNSDTSKWTEYSDKYAVRDYVKDKGFEDILVPLYGKWDNVSSIDFSQLPTSFVLKTNHGSGSIVIVKDKSQCDEAKIRKDIANWLKEPFGKLQGEPHYLSIERCVIAEALLVPSDSFSFSLVDYKIWCFNGTPKYVLVCYNRTSSAVYLELYDTEWNYLPQKSHFTDHYRNGGGVVPKPRNLGKMLEVASRLSVGFPQVRVDLYDNNGQVFFGEMTFTSAGGYMDYFTQDFLNELGDLVKIK